MKWYKFADTLYRNTIDLREYEAEIIAAVTKVKSDCEVIVRENGYAIIPAPSKSEAIKISTELRQGALNQFTFYRPCLFNGYIEKRKMMIPMTRRIQMPNRTEWIDIDEIQRHYLPLGKKKIRRIVKENLDTTTHTGRKILVERKQLEDFLRNEF